MRVSKRLSESRNEERRINHRLSERRVAGKVADNKVRAYEKSKKESLNENSAEKPLNDFDIVLKNYKAHKKARLGESSISYKEVRLLREAVDKANRMKQRLPEADENFAAPAPAAPAPDANAAGGVSPDIQTQIQSLLQQVQTLAQAAGVQVTDFNADPNANVPAVDGMGVANVANPGAAPNNDPNAPLMEAVAKIREENDGKCDEENFVKVKAKFGKTLVESLGITRDRIAMRSAKLDTLNENFEGDFASAYFNNIGLKEATSPIAGIPSEKEIANGTADATKGLAKELKTPVAWPDHQITGAPLQGEGAKQQKVKESVQQSSVTDTYVENYFGEKLSMDSIRESMQKGLLG